MSRVANEFINPLNSDSYAWPVNHSDEDETGVSRSVSSGAKSGNGLVLQQADDQPLIFKYSGVIFHKKQVEEMRDWYLLCRSQTIYFKDYAGDEAEVIVTAFKPTRHRTLRNPRDFPNAPLWYWRYEIEMRVVRVISGMWEGVL